MNKPRCLGIECCSKKKNSLSHCLLALFVFFALTACATQPARYDFHDFVPAGHFGERVRVLELYPGVTATLVAPTHIDTTQRVDLILYALPNGNSTAQTIGRKMAEGVDWHYDIQHIGAQTRALRTRGFPQAIVAYLEADTKSWPEWRRVRGYYRANTRILEIVDQIRAAIRNPPHLVVTLTGHSGGGSFMFGFIEGETAIPSWIERIAFLDANYNFESKHGDKITEWLRRNPRNKLVVIAYDDREITLDGKKVVSDSGGTWRASERMIKYLSTSRALARDNAGEFVRYYEPQIEILLHPNPQNKILHTVMIGEMNAYMHSMLVGREDYDRGASVLKSGRAYEQWVEADIALPAPAPLQIPSRQAKAPSGSEFIASVANLPREEREAAIRRELLSGNIPSFLRKLRTVEVSAIGSDSAKHTISYEVMPDYLAIGSDKDFVRMPMNPYTAEAFCDAFGFVLPTRKMVNDIWAAATTHVDPWPLVVERESPLTFLQHHRIIEEQLKRAERGAFVAGIKKDVVVTNKLSEQPQRVAIFGWHYTNGQPIQPLYAGHVDWYVDYSHGIRPVRRTMRVDAVGRPFEKILADPKLRDLISDEGEISVTHYDRL